jgi:hypothetical protein
MNQNTLASLKDLYRDRYAYTKAFAHLLSLNAKNPKEQVRTKLTESDEEVRFRCPHPNHDDANASFSINAMTGKWFCFVCHRGGEDPISLATWMTGADIDDVSRALLALQGYLPTPTDDVDHYHEVLLNSPKVMQFLLNERGIPKDTLSRFRVGFDGDNYLSLPVFDAIHQCRMFAYHRPSNQTFGSDSDLPKAYFTPTGLGVMLWPESNLTQDNEPIYLFEGWLDAMLANAIGIRGVSVVGPAGGAHAWHPNFNKYFRDRDVYICYDIDQAGCDGARLVAKELEQVARKIYLYDFSCDGMPKNGDFTDFLRLNEWRIDAFLTLEPTDWDNIRTSASGEVVYPVSLTESHHTNFFRKRVQVSVVVAGIMRTYSTPRRCDFFCYGRNTEEYCAECKLCQSTTDEDTIMDVGGRAVRTSYGIACDDPDNIGFIGLPNDRLHKLLKHKFGVPSKCVKFKLEVRTVYNVSEIVVSPDIGFVSEQDSSYILRKVYTITEDTLEANRCYELEGIPMAAPSNQEAILMAYKVADGKNAFNTFRVTPALVRELSAVAVRPDADVIWEMLKYRYKELQQETRIYGRDTLHLAVDLVYHSVKSFSVFGKTLSRGYLCSLIFGDSRTGKSDVVTKLMSYYRLGELVGGESASFAGLVGGVGSLKGEISGVIWGTLPLNNGGLVAIDEAHGLPEEVLANLSQTVSTGVAQITKIQRNRTNAKTRIIFVANPRQTSTVMDNFPYGIEAISSIMGGKTEDITRLDFAVAVNMGDLPQDIIYRHPEPIENRVFQASVCHDLIMWGWTRKAHEIVFVEGTEDRLIEYSKDMVSRYHGSMALVPPAEQVIKLARIAVSLAVMCFSSDATGEKVLVHPAHADVAYQFLRDIYDSPSMGYGQLSRVLTKRDSLQNVERLDSEFVLTEQERMLFLTTDQVTSTMIEHVLDCSKQQAHSFLRLLLASNCLDLTSRRDEYRKKPAFIKWLASSKKGSIIPETVYKPTTMFGGL